MSGSCSTIDANIVLGINQLADVNKYSGLYEQVINSIADELAETYGYLEGDLLENKKAWLTFLNGPREDYDKQLSDFNDIDAFKFILSEFFKAIPDLENAIYTLKFTERSGGYRVSDCYDKKVIGEKQDDGSIIYTLMQQVTVWETTEI